MATGASAAQVKALYEGIAYEEVPLDCMRRTIAKRLVEAKQTIPHFYLTADMDIGRLIAMREEANAAAPQGQGRRAGVQALAQRFHHQGLGGGAAARAGRQRGVGAATASCALRIPTSASAVALDGGLITPVVRNAEAKSLSAISAEMRDLAARARAKKLKPNEYQGGSSAISNLGMYGVREFAAIINPPHATILGGRRGAPRAGGNGRRRRQIRSAR